jgi:threonine/homoserine/homoserine lactone efflux protein
VVITPETSAWGMIVLIVVMMLICALFWLVFIMTLDSPGVRGFLEKSRVTVNRVFAAVLILLAVRVASIER